MNPTFTTAHGRTLTFVFFALCWITNTLNAQAPEWQWAKTTGSPANEFNFSSAIDPSGSGNLYSAGYFEGTVDFDPGTDTFNLTSNGMYDMYISKFDKDGNFLWAQSFGGADYDYAISIAADGFGNIYFVGAFAGTIDFDAGPGTSYLTSSGILDMMVARLDESGHLLWAKSMGGTGGIFGLSLVLDPGENGDIAIAGRFNETADFDPDSSKTLNLTAQDWDIFTLKMDNSGNLRWATSMGSPGFDVAYAVAVDPSGNGDTYTTGSFRGTVDFDPDSASIFNLTATGNQCLFLTKLDANGHFLWANAMTGPNNIYGKAMAIDPSNGDVCLTGVFNGTVDFDPGKSEFNLTGNGYDVYIARLASDGHFLWAKSMGKASFDIGNAIAVDPNGSGAVYTIGNFGGTVDFDPGAGVFNLASKGGDDTFLSKLDQSGNFLWAKSIGGEEGDYGVAIMPDQNGQLYISGYYISDVLTLDSNTLTNSDESATTSDLFIAKLEDDLSSVITDGNEIALSLYPNPASNKLTIALPDQESVQSQITIYNNLGTIFLKIAKQDLGHQYTLDIHTLLPGAYFLSVESEGVKHTGTFSKI